MLWWIYYRRQEGCGCQDANRDPGKRNTKWVGLRCRTRSRPRWVDVITVGGVGEGGGWKRWMGLGHLSILYSLPISTLFLIHNNRLFLIYTTWSSVLNIYISGYFPQLHIFCYIIFKYTYNRRSDFKLCKNLFWFVVLVTYFILVVWTYLNREHKKKYIYITNLN